MKYSYDMKRESLISGVRVGGNHPTRIMGVINVSRESFYKGSVQDKKSIGKTARQMEEEGADFIDIGAMSSAPYLTTLISAQEETERIGWAVKEVRKTCRLPISIDSFRAQPVATGLSAGASIINDITGLRGDPGLMNLLKKAEGVILMAHPSGLKNVKKTKPVSSVQLLLKESVEKARHAGALKSRLILDPGIGFFRNTGLDWWKWDIEILKHLDELSLEDIPLLIGVSRKSFIGYLLGGNPPEKRLPGSLAATVVAVLKGARIIRTHDCAATKEALQILEKLMGKEN